MVCDGSRLSEEQIIGILKEHQAGMSAVDLCRKHGISDARGKVSQQVGLLNRDARPENDLPSTRPVDQPDRRSDTVWEPMIRPGLDRHGYGIEIQTLFRQPVAMRVRVRSGLGENSGGGQSGEPIGQDIGGDPRRRPEVNEPADAEESTN